MILVFFCFPDGMLNSNLCIFRAGSGTVCLSGCKPLLFGQIPYWCVVGLTRFTMCTGYLNCSAKVLSQQACFSSQNEPEAICQLCSTLTHRENSQHSTDPTAGFGEGTPRTWITKGREGNGERKGKMRRDKIPYRHFFIPPVHISLLAFGQVSIDLVNDNEILQDVNCCHYSRNWLHFCNGFGKDIIYLGGPN